MRNKLVFEALQSVPDMVSNYVRWAEVYVDSTYYGLYIIIEDITSGITHNNSFLCLLLWLLLVTRGVAPERGTKSDATRLCYPLI